MRSGDCESGLAGFYSDNYRLSQRPAEEVRITVRSRSAPLTINLTLGGAAFTRSPERADGEYLTRISLGASATPRTVEVSVVMSGGIDGRRLGSPGSYTLTID